MPQIFPHRLSQSSQHTLTTPPPPPPEWLKTDVFSEWYGKTGLEYGLKRNKHFRTKLNRSNTLTRKAAHPSTWSTVWITLEYISICLRPNTRTELGSQMRLLSFLSRCGRSKHKPSYHHVDGKTHSLEVVPSPINRFEAAMCAKTNNWIRLLQPTK